MAATLLRSGTYSGCFTSRVTTVRRIQAVSLAPRVNTIQPCVIPTCSVLGGAISSPLFKFSPARGRGALVVVANAKKSLGCTKQGTRRARRRTSGFRTRMASPTGRKVLKLRRKKGRKLLCPASQRSSAGKKQ
eukprot:gene6102-6340_t